MIAKSITQILGEAEMKRVVKTYSINICDQCIRLEGECCNNPLCVFCRRSIKEVGQILNDTMIRPIVDGERVDTDYAFSLQVERPTVSQCRKATNHARVIGTHFCACTHAMYD